jgi:outer membrane cobalamin receptor
LSDIVLGAIIGATSTAIGALILGILNYKNSKLQIKAHAYEVKIANLIKSREHVLIPLREAITNSLELSNKALIMMIRMGGAYKRNAPKEEIREEIRLWEEASQKSNEALSKFDILRNQVSDVRLYQMIEEIKNIEEIERNNVIEAVALAQLPQSWNLETITRINRQIAESHKRVFDKTLIANKRIEELLSGDLSS